MVATTETLTFHTSHNVKIMGIHPCLKFSMVYQALDIPLKRFSQVLSRVILTFQGFIKGNFSSSV